MRMKEDGLTGWLFVTTVGAGGSTAGRGVDGLGICT